MEPGVEFVGFSRPLWSRDSRGLAVGIGNRVGEGGGRAVGQGGR